MLNNQEIVNRAVRMIIKFRAEKKYEKSDELRDILKKDNVTVQYHRDGSVSWKYKHSFWQHINNT